ncbi:hypothetical protein MHC_04785 [Mycoplasma haemocanis str. Illinois]|uniref:Uncharacterized protein n=1 Tax=Mycoplasma haemocanis (strain Illinois) TaxID=1111676 RepID=H6N841_MYCHN|nr:hypothetical protein [Mycoplasma haemocanis]AEW45813.1 hypothetical protein MHC_04785 [Mycoplasma haemocanis str. Illinois]
MISTTKLLKVGGPVLTGIGGVIATSSLVSKSAEEKPEEKIKTKALKDEEPPIKDYKDANESKSDGKGDGSSGGQTNDEESSENSSSGDQSGEKSENNTGGETETAKDSDTSEAAEAEAEASQDSSEGESDESKGEEGDSGSNGVTQDGSMNAEYDNALGTKYGTLDARMTTRELENTKQTKNQLVDLLEQIKQAIET